jgi:hypothetical protein
MNMITDVPKILWSEQHPCRRAADTAMAEREAKWVALAREIGIDMATLEPVRKESATPMGVVS